MVVLSLFWVVGGCTWRKEGRRKREEKRARLYHKEGCCNQASAIAANHPPYQKTSLTFPPTNTQGYALVEYPTQREAKSAIEGAHGTKLLDQSIGVDFAFVRPVGKEGKGRSAGGGGGGGGKGGKGGRGRSRSGSPGRGEGEGGER